MENVTEVVNTEGTVLDPTIDRYLNGDYAEKNPDWDSGDAPWKAAQVAALLKGRCRPQSIVEVGCGSGRVLVELRKRLPQVDMAGFDIAPAAQRFWDTPATKGIRFVLSDYFQLDEPLPDLILVLDVLEHLGNPWEFLARLHPRCNKVVFHFPLDLSVMSVLRETPLLHVREKVGHLHYFTRSLAIRLLEDAGFDIIEERYTGAGWNAPNLSFRTRIAGFVRRLVFTINHDLGARILGGETLMVLAKPRRES